MSTFFIPIITPTAVNSENCRKECELFRAREAELGRHDLIFPILYIPVMALKYEVNRRQSDVLKVIHARQYADWTRFRRQRVDSVEFATEIDNFCRSICDTLHKPSVSLDERRQQQDENRHTERSQQAGEEQRRKAAKARRVEEAAETSAAVDDMRHTFPYRWLVFSGLAALCGVAVILVLIGKE